MAKLSKACSSATSKDLSRIIHLADEENTSRQQL